MENYLNVAIRAARRAGQVMLEASSRTLNITPKGFGDYVTDIDHLAEKVIIETICKYFPDHQIIAEESGHQGESDYVWIIDPVDGTKNLLHGFPHYCTSIAMRYKHQVIVGVVYNPVTDMLFTAMKGHGAQLNDKKIRVSKVKNLSDSLIIGSLWHLDANDKSTIFEQESTVYSHILRHVLMPSFDRGCQRVCGASALDLCYVAAGMADVVYIPHQTAIWDIAAGVLIVEEAGGMVSHPIIGRNYLEDGMLIAGNEVLVNQLLDLATSTRSSIFKL